MGHEHAHMSSKVKWGALIAGAAIVAGVTLVAPTTFWPAIGKAAQGVITTIAGWIQHFFEPAAKKAAEPLITEATAKLVGGAALIGGGLAYFLSGKKEDCHPSRSYEADESFAMKEDMRKMQALMVARAAAAGHPQAQALMAQQHGLGA